MLLTLTRTFLKLLVRGRSVNLPGALQLAWLYLGDLTSGSRRMETDTIQKSWDWVDCAHSNGAAPSIQLQYRNLAL